MAELKYRPVTEISKKTWAIFTVSPDCSSNILETDHYSLPQCNGGTVEGVRLNHVIVRNYLKMQWLKILSHCG